MNIKIVSNNNTFSDNSQLIGSINENTVPQAQQNEILNELQAIQKKLMSAQELSAQLYQLEQAIRANNQPKIQDIVQRCWVSYSNGFCFRNMIPYSFDYLIYPYYPAYTMGCYQIVISHDNGRDGLTICSAGLRV